jgi:hypothetical protein
MIAVAMSGADRRQTLSARHNPIRQGTCLLDRNRGVEVDEIGGHGRCFSPGGKSLVMAGMLGAKNTSHLRDIFSVERPELEVLLSNSPCFERAWSARNRQVIADTRAIPKAFDRSSRLEVIMAPFQLDLSSAAVNEKLNTRDET